VRSPDRCAPARGNDQASRRAARLPAMPDGHSPSTAHTVSDRTDHPFTRVCDDSNARSQTNQADIERQQQPTPITARSQGSGCPKNGSLDIRVIVTTFRRLALRRSPV
jgi:hypothetical protein